MPPQNQGPGPSKVMEARGQSSHYKMEHGQACIGPSGHVYPLAPEKRSRFQTVDVINGVYFRLGAKQLGEGLSPLSQQQYKQNIANSLDDFHRHIARGYRGNFQMLVEDDSLVAATQALQDKNGWPEKIKDRVNIVTPKQLKERFAHFAQDNAIAPKTHRLVKGLLNQLDLIHSPWMRSDIARLLMQISNIAVVGNRDGKPDYFVQQPAIYADQGLAPEPVPLGRNEAAGYRIPQGSFAYRRENSLLTTAPSIGLREGESMGIEEDKHAKRIVDTLTKMARAIGNSSMATPASQDDLYREGKLYLEWMPKLRQSIQSQRKQQQSSERSRFLVDNWDTFQQLVAGKFGLVYQQLVDSVFFSPTIATLETSTQKDRFIDSPMGIFSGKPPSLDNRGGWCFVPADQAQEVSINGITRAVIDDMNERGFSETLAQAKMDNDSLALSYLRMEVYTEQANFLYNSKVTESNGDLVKYGESAEAKKIFQAFHKEIASLQRGNSLNHLVDP